MCGIVLSEDFGVGRPSREGEDETRSVVQFAFSRDGSAVGEHDVLGNSQAKAGTAGLPGASFIHPVETFEQTRQVFGWNAGTKVADEEFHSGWGGAGAENDPVPRRGVFESVVDQVGKDLVDGFTI